MESYSIHEIKKKTVEELYKFAIELNISHPDTMYKQDLIFTIMCRLYEYGCNITSSGILDIIQDGYGFLRYKEFNYCAGPSDIYVPQGFINKNGLRMGDFIECSIKSPYKGERYFSLSRIRSVNHSNVGDFRFRRNFDDLTPLFPKHQIVLENTLLKNNINGRLIDIIAPIGLGQRALVVAPPRTGKTFLIHSMAHAITANYPDAYLIVLLIGERPEEVTDMIRSVKGEVVSSTFDDPSQRHTQLAEIVIEKAKRLVENQKDVVIILDSITRLARAYNDVAPSSGKILSGGVDSNALQKPKRFFGAARNIEEGGSLTIIATALVETGSRMDEVIFEEFKGTGNSELILDRKISDKRIFPAIDIIKSGTRREDLLVNKDILNKIWVLRRIASNMSTIEALEFIFAKLKITKDNMDFFEQMDTHNPRK
ncbi:transcription termination factor Rho [Lyticum sinuosum]|nr:transcription termination factor Rho [Lyticum sinuosum]